MPANAQQIDLTSLGTWLNAMSQVLGANGKALNTLVNAFNSAKSFHIAGAGTTVAKTSGGTLLTLNINTGAVASQGTVYDAASIGAVAGSLVVGVYTFGTVAPMNVPLGPQGRGLTLNNGLVIVTTGSADVTFGAI